MSGVYASLDNAKKLGNPVDVAHGGTGSTTEAGARTSLGLEIGTNVQAWDAGLDDISALAVTDGNFIVGDGNNWVVESGSTARISLGLGTISTQASDNVSITGGSITGITDLAVADGGNGRSSATAYAVLCGGTSSTGAHQSIASVGSSGEVLTSNGAGALPTFQSFYTTGSFTPTVGGSSVDPDTVTYTDQIGRYTQIGDVVYVFVKVTINTITLGSAAGNLQVRGLSVTAASQAQMGLTAQFSGIDKTTATGWAIGQIGNSSTTVSFIESSDNASAAVTPITGLGNGDQIIITGFYFT